MLQAKVSVCFAQLSPHDSLILSQPVSSPLPLRYKAKINLIKIHILAAKESLPLF